MRRIGAVCSQKSKTTDRGTNHQILQIRNVDVLFMKDKMSLDYFISTKICQEKENCYLVALEEEKASLKKYIKNKPMQITATNI